MSSLSDLDARIVLVDRCNKPVLSWIHGMRKQDIQLTDCSSRNL